VEWSFIELSVCGCGSYGMLALVTVLTKYTVMYRNFMFLI